MRERTAVRGMVTVTVRGGDGRIRTERRSLLRRMLRLAARPMVYSHHNTITLQGDGLMADMMSGTPTQVKLTSATGYMQAGTGWTGNTPKANTRCNAPTGALQRLDEGYPKTQGAFGDEGQSTVVFRATFPPGTLDADGINECALLNGGTGTAKCLAYAQLVPAVNVTKNDSLTVCWSVSFCGE